MDNQAQLKLIKASVEGWNQWREAHPYEKITLQEANLMHTNLRGVNLEGADLRKAYLSESNLREANFTRANLTEAYLSGANLREAYLMDAKLIGANLVDAKLMKTMAIEADLTGAKLMEANLWDANLYNATLVESNLARADLTRANLMNANLVRANLGEANLLGTDLTEANLEEADLAGAMLAEAILADAKLRGSDLSGAFLRGANLSGADLSNANLHFANIVQTKVDRVKISGSKVYGISVWDLEGEFAEQKELIITPDKESLITVDNIKVAQFIYLLVNNKEIRDVINILTSKTVLILGRFALPERKIILDALRDKLREFDLLPIVFDFECPTDKDFTETIKTLASISYFVIADVTNPKSSPLELQATVPDYQIPFVPIIQEGEKPFSMMANLQTKYSWVLDMISYDTVDTLIDILKPYIIDPAIKKRDELRIVKARIPTIISGKELRKKEGRL